MLNKSPPGCLLVVLFVITSLTTPPTNGQLHIERVVCLRELACAPANRSSTDGGCCYNDRCCYPRNGIGAEKPCHICLDERACCPLELCCHLSWFVRLLAGTGSVVVVFFLCFVVICFVRCSRRWADPLRKELDRKTLEAVAAIEAEEISAGKVRVLGGSPLANYGLVEGVAKVKGNFRAQLPHDNNPHGMSQWRVLSNESYLTQSYV